MNKIVLILAMASLFSCETNNPNSDKKLNDDKLAAACIENIDPNIACIEIYDPVCGCNGKTYSNACFAGAAKIKVSYIGECKK